MRHRAKHEAVLRSSSNIVDEQIKLFDSELAMTGVEATAAAVAANTAGAAEGVINSNRQQHITSEFSAAEHQQRSGTTGKMSPPIPAPPFYGRQLADGDAGAKA